MGKDYRRAALLAWLLGLVLTEVLGLSLAYFAYNCCIGEVYAVGVADAVIVTIRFLFLSYIAGEAGESLTFAVYKPAPRGRKILLLLGLAVAVALLDYYFTASVYANSKPYELQLVDYGYYAGHGVAYLFPLKVLYYFSEVVAMNYMYILARKAWGIFKYPFTAGTLFLVLGWALPHALTKDVLAAVYAVALTVVFYTGYEYAKTPVAPIIMWFTVLVV